MAMSQHWGVLSRGPYNKVYSVFGSIPGLCWGFLILGNCYIGIT